MENDVDLVKDDDVAHEINPISHDIAFYLEPETQQAGSPERGGFMINRQHKMSLIFDILFSESHAPNSRKAAHSAYDNSTPPWELSKPMNKLLNDGIFFKHL